MGWDWKANPLPAQGFTTGSELPDAWKEALACTADDGDWEHTPAHVEEFLDWYAQTEDKDEWTDPRIITPAGVGQVGDQVSLNQKWWILLFLGEGVAYRVRPTYRPLRRPRSRPGSPLGARWEERRGRSGAMRRQEPPQGSPLEEHRLDPPPLGGKAEEEPNPWDVS